MSESSGSPSNQAQIKCPMTQGEESLKLCIYKRNRKWKGRSSGSALCDCAMDAGKCTAAKMMNQEFSSKRTNFFSSTERVIEVPKEIVANVGAVIATQSMLSQYPILTADEIERLSTAVHIGEAKEKPTKTRKRKPTPDAAPKNSEQLFNEAIEQPE